MHAAQLSSFNIPQKASAAEKRTKLAHGLKSKKLFFLLAETFQALGDSSRIQSVWVTLQS
jgi:hypothetical protein